MNTFDRMRKTTGLFLAPLLLACIYLLPVPTLSKDAHALMAILFFIITLWVTEAIPIPIASLLGPVLTVVFGVAGAKEAFAPFANPIIMLFLGGFMLAEAMSVHGLDRRFAIGILSFKFVSRHANFVVLIFGLIVLIMSMWISNTATTAMMFPIALGLIRTLNKVKSKDTLSNNETTDSFAVSMFLIAAYMSSAGGIATPIGSPTNLVGIAMLDKLAGINIPFLTWMEISLPVSAILFMIIFVYFIRFSPPSKEISSLSSAYFLKEKKALGPWSRGQINSILAFFFAVILWIYPGILALLFGTDSPQYINFNSAFPEGVAALLAASLLFILPVDWKERKFTLNMKQALNIDWGTLLLVGGALSLGNLMFSTGLAENFSTFLIKITGIHTVFGITALAVFLSVLITQTTSNTAVANMLIPLIIAISNTLEINPVSPVIGATLGSSMAFTLPSGTAPNALVYGSGLVPITSMIKHGLFISILAYIIILSWSLLIPYFIGIG